MTLAGAFGVVRVPGASKHERILVADRAIGSDQDQKYAIIVQPDGLTKYQRVELGPIVDGLRVVRSGLKGDETIIVEGIGKVRPDSKVFAKQTDMSKYATEQLAIETHVNAGLSEEASRVADDRASTAASLVLLPLESTMKFSHFFIDRPVFAMALSILIVLWGGVAYLALPVAQYPDIVPPTVQIQANYPGADPQVVADTVAEPIEEQVNGVENMLYMSSQMTNNGLVTITVTFGLGTDTDKAQTLVQNRAQKSVGQFNRSQASAIYFKFDESFTYPEKIWTTLAL